jgi:ribA/ribD-fused uncharacterized protein
MTEEKYTFFWNGPFSQWDASPFMDVEGIMYNCAEQAMMAQKALIFKDQDIYAKIMSSDNPREQKALGRQVKNFNPKVWDCYSTMVVYDANLLKYSQNKKHLEKLLETKGTTLVEASPYDKIWGVSLSADDPRILKMETWQGQNRLGFILTRIREVIISELSNTPDQNVMA